jgi:hypothetical protein
MKKILLCAAAVSGLTLIGASPPAYGDPEEAGAYPPCSSSVTDRCIQLYERGVATEENLAFNEDVGPAGPEPGMGGPYETAHAEHDDSEAGAIREARSDYPACSATVTDGCIQGRGYRMAGHPKKHEKAHKAKEMRLAMRAGERG